MYIDPFKYFYEKIDLSAFAVSDNLILINRDETGAGVTNNIAGIEIERGTLNNAQLVFNESLDKWQIGIVGDEFENIATEPYVDAADAILQTQIDDLDANSVAVAEHLATLDQQVLDLQNFELTTNDTLTDHETRITNNTDRIVILESRVNYLYAYFGI